MVTQNYLTIKEAAYQYNRSEQTIRRLVKQYILTSHIKLEEGPKGKKYLISQALLGQEYQDVTTDSLPTVVIDDTIQLQNYELREMIAERDKLIQQLQNRLFEQGGMLNTLAAQVSSQMTNQKIDRIEELVVQQTTQIKELQQRLSTSNSEEPYTKQRSLWHRIFGN